MPDLLAGSDITALDTPPPAHDEQPDAFSFNSSVFGVDADSGTYADCGAAFLACTTGRAVISYNAQASTTAGSVIVSPVVREGATVGAGAPVEAASEDEGLTKQGADEQRAAATRFVEGLTPGNVYNVRLEHRVSSGGTATVRRRSVIVSPAT